MCSLLVCTESGTCLLGRLLLSENLTLREHIAFGQAGLRNSVPLAELKSVADAHSEIQQTEANPILPLGPAPAKDPPTAGWRLSDRKRQKVVWQSG